MDKDGFTKELKELISDMSEEEIEKTISALSDCKFAIYKKNNQEKENSARLFLNTKRQEAEFQYTKEGNTEGIINSFGVSLLTNQDFDMLKDNLPKIEDEWWLYNTFLVTGDCRDWILVEKKVGKIRPVIIIENIQGNLRPGETFFINNDEFKLLTKTLAIRTKCLGGLCTYHFYDYENSIIPLCLEGWYKELIDNNNVQKIGASAVVEQM